MAGQTLTIVSERFNKNRGGWRTPTELAPGEDHLVVRAAAPHRTGALEAHQVRAATRTNCTDLPVPPRKAAQLGVRGSRFALTAPLAASGAGTQRPGTRAETGAEGSGARASCAISCCLSVPSAAHPDSGGPSRALRAHLLACGVASACDWRSNVSRHPVGDAHGRPCSRGHGRHSFRLGLEHGLGGRIEDSKLVALRGEPSLGPRADLGSWATHCDPLTSSPRCCGVCVRADRSPKPWSECQLGRRTGAVAQGGQPRRAPVTAPLRASGGVALPLQRHPCPRVPAPSADTLRKCELVHSQQRPASARQPAIRAEACDKARFAPSRSRATRWPFHREAHP